MSSEVVSSRIVRGSRSAMMSPTSLLPFAARMERASPEVEGEHLGHDAGQPLVPGPVEAVGGLQLRAPRLDGLLDGVRVA